MIIRGASGFGDAFYLWPVCDYYRANGYDVTPMTDHTSVFPDFRCTSFDRIAQVDIDCTYVRRRHEPTNTWQDTCIAANMPTIPFRHYHSLLPQLKRRYILIQPYQPSWCLPADNFVPNTLFFSKLEKALQTDGWTGITLTNEDGYTAAQWFDIYSGARLIISQSSSHMVMAEAWGRDCICVFNRQSLDSGRNFVKYCQPSKTILRPTSTLATYDDEDAQAIYQSYIKRTHS